MVVVGTVVLAATIVVVLDGVSIDVVTVTAGAGMVVPMAAAGADTTGVEVVGAVSLEQDTMATTVTTSQEQPLRMARGYRCAVIAHRPYARIVEFDGKKQRNALTAAENAVRALASGNADRATANARRAAELDQIGVYGGFAGAVVEIASDLDDAGPTAAQWDEVVAHLEPGPLSFLVEELRD